MDRLLSNRGVDVWSFFAYWTPFIVGARTEVIVALDWTSFAADGQDTIVLSMVTGHGRATPLLWKTVASSTLRCNQQVSGSSPLAGSSLSPYCSETYGRTPTSTSVASARVGCT